MKQDSGLINGVRCDAEAKLRQNIEDGVHGGFYLVNGVYERDPIG